MRSDTETLSAVSGQGGSSVSAGARLGDYVLIRLLGRGGMGDVYEAEHAGNGRRVALKILTHLLGNGRERFLREGRVAASVSHANTVYVYGTEDIGGTLVIAMELVGGGTLKDRIQRDGPMHPVDAVEAILQVIAGLEAAHAKGVLHRDIKPANCFVEMDGTVKIGDFGLSTAPGGEGEAHLTVAGSFLGTPAFASPEQLRGEELDVRSDLYSVGATLYYLLTGRAPFDKQGVALIADVLNRAPESLRKITSSVPKGLAQVVLKCLEKNPASRFPNYSALTEALAPFRATATTPATIYLRIAAALIDWTISVLTAIVLMVATGQVSVLTGTASRPILAGAVTLAIMLLYPSITEGLWGASLGKAIFGLRVVRVDGSPAGLARASCRAALYLASGLVAGAVIGERLASIFALTWLLHGILFVTMRRRNGFAGIHELLTGTRTVTARGVHQPDRTTLVQQSAECRLGGERIGAYAVVGTLRESNADGLVLGFDESLNRPVWIRTSAVGSLPISDERRDLRRPARLRWLGAGMTPDLCWDAFEAPTGMSLAQAAATPQPWRRVRHWLNDLLTEIQEGACPAPLHVDRVWITADNRALLLDFDAAASGSDETSGASPQLFLFCVASIALGGIDRPLPMRARAFLKELEHGTTALSTVVERLRSLLDTDCEVSRVRRLGVIFGSSLMPLFFTMVMVAGTIEVEKLFQKYADLDELPPSLRRIGDLRSETRPELVRERELLESYVATKHRDAIRDPTLWALRWKDDKVSLRAIAESSLTAHSPIGAAELVKVSEELSDTLWDVRRYRRHFAVPRWTPVLFLTIATFWCAGAGLCFLSSILSRGGLFFRALAIEVVDRKGSKASRLRVAGRALIAMAVALASLPIMRFAMPLDSLEVFFYMAMVVMAVEFVWSLVRPGRGLQDWIAGTYLVPR
jgi:uncharacterized RDD family membrane protein YckC/predicted Ser/Thr protein kinase